MGKAAENIASNSAVVDEDLVVADGGIDNAGAGHSVHCPENSSST